jgi:hypothetical protein
MRKAFALGIPLAYLVVACTYDNGDAHRVLYSNTVPASCETPSQSTIDADAQLVVDAGLGAGVFIEYATGGHYHLRTSCDTTRSNTSCHWDVIITPEGGATITNTATESLTGTDSFHVYPDQSGSGNAPVSYQLTAVTTTELDGVSFDIDPGAAISVDAFLDSTCALPFFFWQGGGAVHEGSPSNPLQLTPTSD